MTAYLFKKHSELDADQQAQVQAMLEDKDNPLPIGFADTVSLYGYLQEGSVAAWAWGSATGPLGELHLIVAPAHRRKKLGPRLALRYFLERNEAITNYQFVVTNPAALHDMLVAQGFQHQAEDDAYLRDQFSADEVDELQRLASLLKALDEKIDAP